MFKENKIALILLALLLLACWFYWFQYRPAQIKHACSWITRRVPARKALTMEELKEKGFIYDCNNLPIKKTGIIQRIGMESKESCEKENRETIKFWGNSIPEVLDIRKTTDEEYKFCLREKGL